MLGLGLGLRSMGQSLQQKADAILRSFGSNASRYPFSTRQGAYQTEAGPAAAAVNDPVGLELDALGTVGPELVTNGANFVNTAGWAGKAGASVSAVGGNLVCTAGASVFGSASYAITLVVGKTYRLAFDLISNAGAAGMYAFVSDNASGDTNRSLALNSPDTPGNTTVYFTAITDASFIVIGAGLGGFDPGETFALNNISCVQVTGNHATQTIAGDRPLLAQDGGGRWYASFNGTNQSLSLASTLTAVAGTFICCARADVLHYGTLVGNGGNDVSEPGISLGTANNGKLRAVFGNGTITNQAVSIVDTYTPGEMFVVSVQWDMSFIKIRKNSGTTGQVANPLGDLTSAMLGSIGRIGPIGSDYFNGSIYDAIAIKGVVSASQLLTLEEAAAQRAGITL